MEPTRLTVCAIMTLGRAAHLQRWSDTDWSEMGKLITSKLTYQQELLDAWIASPSDILAQSNASPHITGIIGDKVGKRSGTWFFGEAFVANEFSHELGFYGSFKWLTNPRFVDVKPFPCGNTTKYQEALREALWEHFGRDQLERLQDTTAAFFKKHRATLKGKEPAPPDLWLIGKEDLRFIEVKLPGDWIKPHQLAGLALIGSCLQATRRVSTEIVEVNPALDDMFADFCDSISGRKRARIIWVEDNALVPGGGHGVDFFNGPAERSAELIAVLRGFEWLHGDPDTVEVRIRSAGTVLNPVHPRDARPLIERYVRRGKPVEGKIGPSLYAHVNG